MPFREEKPSLMRIGINRSPKKLLTYLRASLFPVIPVHPGEIIGPGLLNLPVLLTGAF
jgi:hypothetical protein